MLENEHSAEVWGSGPCWRQRASAVPWVGYCERSVGGWEAAATAASVAPMLRNGRLAAPLCKVRPAKLTKQYDASRLAFQNKSQCFRELQPAREGKTLCRSVTRTETLRYEHITWQLNWKTINIKLTNKCFVYSTEWNLHIVFYEHLQHIKTYGYHSLVLQMLR